MQANHELVERLAALSAQGRYDVRTRFDWPMDVNCDRLWCDEELLTTYGTEVHGAMEPSALIALSKWEAINFFSLNVTGIKDAMSFLCQKMYEDRYLWAKDYMHIFLEEENNHLWFFAKFCLDYVGKYYSSRWPQIDELPAELERDFLMFSSILIFEEFVDYYNRRVGANPEVLTIIREINRQHHLDESRHVSFGREVVKRLHEDIMASARDPEETRRRLEERLKKKFLYFISNMYNPKVYTDSRAFEAAGMRSAIQMRNHLRNSPHRKNHHRSWFQRTATFFHRLGVIQDVNFLVHD